MQNSLTLAKPSAPNSRFLRALTNFRQDLTSVQSRDLDLLSTEAPQDEISLSYGQDRNLQRGFVDIPGFGKLDTTHGGETFKLSKSHPERETPEASRLNLTWKTEYEFKDASGDIFVSETLTAKDKLAAKGDSGWLPVYQESYTIKQAQGIIADTRTRGSIEDPQGEFNHILDNNFSFYVPADCRL